ncbi:MAG: TonB-dependent receptor plug domain-containing protein, partial [Polyangia bacterium]
MQIASKHRTGWILRRGSAALVAGVALGLAPSLWAQDAGQNETQPATTGSAATVQPQDAGQNETQPATTGGGAAATDQHPALPPETGKVTQMPEVVVHGRAEDILGIAVGASEGAIGEADLKDLPLLRRGELMETVPGLVVTQHSGDGKANQYFLRGFNLDHGTDFAFSVDDVPVNLPSHAHGQGYSDLNFMIPELVDFIDYRKGPFYSEVGDFSGAGAADVHLVNTLPQGTINLQGGQFAFARALVAESPTVGPGTLLYALEYNHYNGPWVVPENSNRWNGLLRYHWTNSNDQYSLTASVYVAPNWYATDQVAQRAITQGLISRFGALDPSDGGNTGRGALSFNWTRKNEDGMTKLTLYGFYYRMNLFSDFTYYLNDPVNGDQFEQIDRRYVTGADLKRTWNQTWFG